MKNILKENMNRFRTKNLSEQDPAVTKRPGGENYTVRRLRNGKYRIFVTKNNQEPIDSAKLYPDGTWKDYKSLKDASEIIDGWRLNITTETDLMKEWKNQISWR